jgi:hypothetical protein
MAALYHTQFERGVQFSHAFWQMIAVIEISPSTGIAAESGLGSVAPHSPRA